MTSPPITAPGPYTVYTGRTTSWPMVASTCCGALLIVLMARQHDAPWADIAVPLLLIAIGVLANIPLHNSMLSDYYTPNARPTVFANHTNALYLGAICGPAFVTSTSLASRSDLVSKKGQPMPRSLFMLASSAGVNGY